MKLFLPIVFGVLVIAATPAEVVAASLRGSTTSMARQNRVADAENLSRLSTYQELQSMKRNGYLVRLPNTRDVIVDPRLKVDYAWCRPWVRTFLINLGKEFRAKFGKVLQVNSAVRTVEYQKKLQGTNGNAAGTNGSSASSHLTGATVDIAKRGLTKEELKWLQEKFLAKEKDGFIEATEEHKQAVFHVMIFRDRHR